MGFPFRGHHSPHHHQLPDDEERRSPPVYPPPGTNPYSPRDYPPPPPFPSSAGHDPYHSHPGPPPPPAPPFPSSRVEHVAHERNLFPRPGPPSPPRGHHHPHVPHFPGIPHHRRHPLPRGQDVRVFCQAETDYSLTIRDGSVVLARANPGDEFQALFSLPQELVGTFIFFSATNRAPTMDFPFRGHHSHHHHQRTDDEERRSPPVYPPPSHHEQLYPPPGTNPYSPRDYPPPPPFPSSAGHDPFHRHPGPLPPPAPPPSSRVEHVAHESNLFTRPDPPSPPRGHHHPHVPHFPGIPHQRRHPLPRGQDVRVFCQAETDYSLTIRDGSVVLARANPGDEFQHWIKDEKYSTKVKDLEGYPCFALVNKATGQALQHSIGATQPVCLTAYQPDEFDQSILWSMGKDFEHGFRTIRMVNNIHLNLDAFKGVKEHGGVHDGTVVGLWKWNKGDNQKWKIVPYCKEA